jgi:hypothetical protein
MMKKYLTSIKLYGCLALMIISSLVPLQAFAYDQGFFAANDILFYNPDDTGCGSTSAGLSSDATLTGSNNPQKAFNYFMSKGLTAIQTVGIMGNIESETAGTFRPDIVQGMTYSDVMKIDGVTGYGLSQWTSLDRQEGLHALAQKNGVKDSDLATQLDYIWQELNGSFSRAMSELKKADNVSDATSAILNFYEMPAERVKNLEVRTTYADQFLAKFGNGAVDNIGCGNSDTTGNTAGQYGWDLTGPHAMTYYSQCDPAWGSEPYGKGKTSICSSGCGITSIAMAVATLTGNSKITPATLAARYGDEYHTDGTSWAVFPVVAQDYGLKEQDMGTTLGGVAAMLERGGLVIGSFNTGAFTTEGHFMVIRAISADGSKFYIADPYNNIHSGPYTADYLYSPGNLVHLWGYYK